MPRPYQNFFLLRQRSCNPVVMTCVTIFEVSEIKKELTIFFESRQFSVEPDQIDKQPDQDSRRNNQHHINFPFSPQSGCYTLIFYCKRILCLSKKSKRERNESENDFSEHTK